MVVRPGLTGYVQLLADLPDVLFVWLEGEAGNVAGGGVAVGPVAGWDFFRRTLPGQPEVRNAMTGVDDLVIQFRARQDRSPPPCPCPSKDMCSTRRLPGNRSNSGRAEPAATGRAAWPAGGPLMSRLRGKSRTCGCGHQDRRCAATRLEDFAFGLAHADDDVHAEFLRARKMSRASSNTSQYFSHLCGDCTPLPRVRSKISGVAASSATVKMSAPRSLSFWTSVRSIVVGLDRIDTGIVFGSIRSVHFFSTATVSSSERGWVIIEIHIRWKGLFSPSLATLSIITPIGTAGQSTRMKFRSA